MWICYSHPFLVPFFLLSFAFFVLLFTYFFVCLWIWIFTPFSDPFLSHFFCFLCLIIYIFLFYVCKFGYSLPFLIPFFLLSFTFYVLLFTYFFLFLCYLNIHSLFCSLLSPFFRFLCLIIYIFLCTYVCEFGYSLPILITFFLLSFAFYVALFTYFSYMFVNLEIHSLFCSLLCPFFAFYVVLFTYFSVVCSFDACLSFFQLKCIYTLKAGPTVLYIIYTKQHTVLNKLHSESK